METDKFERLVKALAALAYQRPVNVLPGNAPGWVGLTDEEIREIWLAEELRQRLARSAR